MKPKAQDIRENASNHDTKERLCACPDCIHKPVNWFDKDGNLDVNWTYGGSRVMKTEKDPRALLIPNYPVDNKEIASQFCTCVNCRKMRGFLIPETSKTYDKCLFLGNSHQISNKYAPKHGKT